MRLGTLVSLALQPLVAACSSSAVIASQPAGPPAMTSPTLSAPRTAVQATPPQSPGFQAWLESIRARALAEGIRAATLDAALPNLTFNQRVVELDRNQPDDSSTGTSPSMAGYLARRLDAARIEGGQTRYLNLRPQLAAFESRFGVPGAILVGIWGMETNYGSYTGNFDVLQAVASLAYDGRRRALFTAELIAALQIIDRGLAPRYALTGSWAGAMGNPQFLPSSYLKSAVDGDGDGKSDIWQSPADALASIANYLAKAGWRRGEPWGLEVRVPAGLNRAGIANTTVSQECPRVHARHSRWMTVAEWRALGLVPTAKGWPADNLRATLIEADGPGGRAFLAFDNYRALLNYNCSNYYAVSVGLLADALSR